MSIDPKDAPGQSDDAAREAQHLSDRAMATTRGMAEQQKTAGAEHVEHIAEAMRSSAERLQPGEQQLAELVGSAAGQLETFAHSLRQKDFGALVAEVEDFGRRQPAVFMGAAVALGFGIARLAKANSDQAGARRYGHSSSHPHGDNDDTRQAPADASGLGDYPGTAYRGAAGAPQPPTTTAATVQPGVGDRQ